MPIPEGSLDSSSIWDQLIELAAEWIVIKRRELELRIEALHIHEAGAEERAIRENRHMDIQQERIRLQREKLGYWPTVEEQKEALGLDEEEAK